MHTMNHICKSRLSGAPGRRSGSCRGSALLELSIVLPLLATLAIGAVDFGRLFYSALTVAGASRAGVQYGLTSQSRSTDTAGMVNVALRDARNLAGVSADAERYCQCGSGPAVSCTTTCSVGTVRRTYVKVTARQTFQTLVSYPGIPSRVALVSTNAMRVR